MTISLDDQIKAAARELAMRRNVYPKWIANKRLKPDAAAHEIAAMEAILETLKRVGPIADALDKAAAGMPYHGHAEPFEALAAQLRGPDDVARLAHDRDVDAREFQDRANLL